MPTTDHKLAPGWNNEAGLTAVEEDIPTFQGQPFYVRSNGPGAGPDEGILRPRGDSSIGRYGFQRWTWIADVMSAEQYAYIRDTYTPGGNGFSAQMTVQTIDPDDPDDQVVFNATLLLPKRADLDAISGAYAYTNVPLLFIIEEFL